MQPLMFHPGVYQTFFIVVVLLFGLQQFPAIWSTLQLRGRAGSSTDDRGSYLAVQVVVVVGILLGYQAATHLTSTTITWHRPLVFFLGIAIAVFGSLLSWLAVRQLGRYFTVVVAVRSDQPVIQSGVYRLVRRPSYLCSSVLPSP